MSSGRSSVASAPGGQTSSPPSRRGGGVRPLAASCPPATSSPTGHPPVAEIPTSASITGPHATKEARLFVDAFLPLAVKTDRARSLRKREWKSHLDTGGNRRISPGTAELWIHRTLRNSPSVKNAGQGQAQGHSGSSSGAAQKASTLFKRYKPSYIHAYNASIAHAASSSQHAQLADDATVGSAASSARWGDPHSHRNDAQFVSQREFRLLVSNVCFHALAYDAFAIVDVDGTGRITRQDFVERIGEVRHHGFETLRLIGSGGGESLDESAYWDPHAVFDRMDADNGGMVLFGEWANFLKMVEMECAVQHRRRQQAIAANGGEEADEAPAAGGGAFWGELLTVSDLGVASTTQTTAGMTSAGDSESDVSVLSGFSLSSTPSLGTARSAASTPVLRSTPRGGTGRTTTPRGGGGGGLSTPSKRATSIPSLRFSPPAQSSANNFNFNRPQSVVGPSTLSSEIDSLKLQLQSAQDELAAAQAELASARGEADDLRTALRDAQASHDERISMLEFLSDEGLVELKEEVERLESVVRAKAEECEDLARRLEECQALHEVSKREVEDVRGELEDCRAERDEWKDKLNDETAQRLAEAEGLRKELDDVRQQRDEADKSSSSRVDALRLELAEAKRTKDEEMGALQAELSDARSAGKARMAEVESLKEDLAVAREASKASRSELARTTWKVEEAQGELELMAERVNSYKDLNAKMTKELHFTNDELIRSEEKAERLRWQLDTKVAALQTEAGMAQSEANNASEEIWSERKSRAEAEEQNRKLTIEIEILRADLETAKAAAVEATERADAARRSRIEEVSTLAEEVAASRLAVEARDAEVASLRKSVRTLESDQSKHQAAADAQNQKGAEELRAEVDSIRRERDAALEKARGASLRVSELQDERDQHAETIRGLEADVSELSNVSELVGELSEQNERLSAASAKLMARSAALAAEREKLVRDLDSSRREIAALEGRRRGETEEGEEPTDEAAAGMLPADNDGVRAEICDSAERTRTTAGSEWTTKENGSGDDGTHPKSRSLDFGSDDGTTKTKKSNCFAVFVYVFGLLFAAVCAFLICSQISCPSSDDDSDEKLAAKHSTIEPEQAVTTETCPSTDNFTAAISALEGALRRKEAECETKSRECKLDATRLSRELAEYETKCRDRELQVVRLSAESDALRSSYRACSEEVEAHRGGAEECTKQLKLVEDARDDSERRLHAVRLSLNECELKLEGEKASALSMRTDCDQLASRYNADVADAKREARAVEEAKQVTERSLEHCEESSRAKDTDVSEMKVQYDRLLEEYRPLARDDEGSERRPDDHVHNDGDGSKVSTPRQKLGSKFRVSHDKRDKSTQEAKRTGKDDEDLDWISVFWAF